MFIKLFRFAAIAACLAFPFAANAADPKTDAPTVLVRVQSVNDLIKTGQYVATLLPEDGREQVKQGLDFIKSLIDEKKGIEGIGVSGPIGIYASLTAEVTSSPVVVLIPIADEKTVMDALKTRANLEPKKRDDGSFEVQPEGAPVTVFFRFANNYAYVTANDPENIAVKNLPKPEAVLGGRPEHLISVSIRIDRLPEQMKKMALGFIENKLAEGKDQKVPNETKAIKAFKEQTIDVVAGTIKSVLNDGREVALRINIDPKTEEFALELELAGTSGSKLAKDFASIKENKSVVAGAIGSNSSDAAMAFNLSISLADALKKTFGPVVDDGIEQAKKQANVPGEVLTKIEPLLKAITPTLKAGDLDLGMTLIGPDKDDKYTLAAGIRLKDGKKVEEAIKELVKKELPPEYSGFFAMDAEKLDNGCMLHTIRVNTLLDEKSMKVFGKNDVQLTIRDDFLVVGFGPRGKEVVQKAAGSKADDVGVMQVKIAMSRAAVLLGENATELAAAKKAAEKIFGGKPTTADSFGVWISGGESLKIKLAAKGKALQFLAEMGQNQKKAD